MSLLFNMLSSFVIVVAIIYYIYLYWHYLIMLIIFLLRNLYAGQEATVRTGHGAIDCFQIGKGVHQGCILSPCLFNLYAEYIMRNAGLEEAQARIKIAGRNINNLRYADDTTLMAESEEELKSLLMKVKEESGKSWLKAQHSENEDYGIWSHHFMTKRWGNSGNSVRLYFLGSKITADGDCSHEIKRNLLLGRKVMTNLDSTLKSRDITLPTMFFPVVMYGYESWTVKKAECRRIDAFELWCWRRLLRVPCAASRSNQSILKEISPGCSLEGLMLKLKLQYFGHLMWRVTHLKRPWCWEGLGAGGEGNNRGWDVWIASSTRWTWVWVNSGSWWWTGRSGVLWFMESQRQTRLSDWTKLNNIL